jgi:hypothetical protein
MFGIPKIWGMERKMWQDNYATLIVGRKRQGKSTLLSMICQGALASGYKVYSNYPIDGAVKIPKIIERDGRLTIDKDFLYNNPLLEDSYVLLDEVSTIWNNRAWGKWGEDDSEFFNFLGKYNIRLFMVSQYYDMVDLNVKRNLDSTWFVERSVWPNTSIVECDIQDVRKVANTQGYVLDNKFMQVSYEPCVIPDGRYYFRRKKWYPFFLTLYKEDRHIQDWHLQDWRDLCFSSLGDGGGVAPPPPKDNIMIKVKQLFFRSQ